MAEGVAPTTDLILYNTMMKRKELFVPRNGKVVKLFTCGPSVYRKQHLGNYRTFLFEDILQKYLEYKGYRVERCINYTDIEDKTIEEAKSQGKTLSELTQPVIDTFEQEAKRLRIDLPADIPRATTSVDQAVTLIETLLEKGLAYWHDGNVYYDVLKYEPFGQVFGLDMSRWPDHKVRFSRDTYEGLRWNLGDFILWHGFQDGDSWFWKTSLGKGRPAWNVQDPAMMTKVLGYDLDIHTGGIDNVYRHHDYNRAVVEGVSGMELAHYWMHGEHLIVNGRKMSKSTGNTLYPGQMIEEGYTPDHLRFHLIYGYYRDRMNITDSRLEETKEILRRFRADLHFVLSGEGAGPSERDTPDNAERLIRDLRLVFEKELDNDLHVKAAFDGVSRIIRGLARVRRTYGLQAKQVQEIKSILTRQDHVFGVLFPWE